MMAHILTATAIHWKFPDHSISTLDNEITLFEPGPIPTQVEIDGYIVEYEAHLKATEYMKKRKREYPSIEDQFDMIFWDKKNGTTEWEDSIQVIKNKYPK